MKKILIVLMLGLFFGIAPITLQALYTSVDDNITELNSYSLREVFTDVLHPLNEYIIHVGAGYDLKNDYVFDDLGNKTITQAVSIPVTINSMVKNGNAVNISEWTKNNGTLTATNNVFTYKASAQNGYIRQEIPLISGHVYYIKSDISVASSSVSFFLNDGISNFATASHSASAGYETISAVGTAGATGNFYLTINDARASGWTDVLIKNITMIDLSTLGTHPTYNILWSSLSAVEIDPYIKDLDTTAEIVAKAIAGGETTKAVNGEFATALGAEWTNAGATNSISGGNLLNTLTSPATNGATIQLTATALSTGKMYAVQTRFKVNTSNVTNVKIYLDGSTAGTNKLIYTKPTPTIDTWFDVLIIDSVPTDATGNIKVIIDHSYASGGAGTEILEIDYLRIYDITNYTSPNLYDLPNSGDFWYSIYDGSYIPTGTVDFGTEILYFHSTGSVYNVGKMIDDDIYSDMYNKGFAELNDIQRLAQRDQWALRDYNNLDVLSFTDYLFYDADGTVADMITWYNLYLSLLDAEALEKETISDNEEVILIITMILFIIGVVLAIYTKNRVLFMASGLLFFVPIFIVDNLFIIVFSAIMILMMGVIAFYQPNKEGFES